MLADDYDIYIVNAINYILGIVTAAIEMLMGDSGVKQSRKPEIMADAAYAILCKSSQEMTGQFLIDDDVLKNEGITDLEPYSHVPGKCFSKNFILLHVNIILF